MVVKMRGCTGSVREEAVDAVMTHGTSAATISGFAARLAFEQAPPVDHEHLVLVDELLGRADRFGRLAAVVLADVLDHAAVDPAPPR